MEKTNLSFRKIALIMGSALIAFALSTVLCTNVASAEENYVSYKGFNEHYYDAEGYHVDPTGNGDDWELDNTKTFFTRLDNQIAWKGDKTKEIPKNLGICKLDRKSNWTQCYYDLLGENYVLKNPYYDDSHYLFSTEKGDYDIFNLNLHYWAGNNGDNNLYMDYSTDCMWYQPIETFHVWFGVYDNKDGSRLDVFHGYFDDRTDDDGRGDVSDNPFSIPDHVKDSLEKAGYGRNLYSAIYSSKVCVQLDSMIADCP